MIFCHLLSSCPTSSSVTSTQPHPRDVIVSEWTRSQWCDALLCRSIQGQRSKFLPTFICPLQRLTVSNVTSDVSRFSLFSDFFVVFFCVSTFLSLFLFPTLDVTFETIPPMALVASSKSATRFLSWRFLLLTRAQASSHSLVHSSPNTQFKEKRIFSSKVSNVGISVCVPTSGFLNVTVLGFFRWGDFDGEWPGVRGFDDEGEERVDTDLKEQWSLSLSERFN